MLLFLLAIGIVSAQFPSPEQFTKVNPYLTTLPFQYIANGAGVYVILTQQQQASTKTFSPVLFTTTDLINFQTRTCNDSSSIYISLGLVYGSQGFLAALGSSDGSSVYFYQSTDGYNWNYRWGRSQVFDPNIGLFYQDGKYVMFGSNGTRNGQFLVGSYSSQDTINWTPKTTGIALSHWPYTYSGYRLYQAGGSFFMQVWYSNNGLYSSQDLSTWTQVNLGGSGLSASSVIEFQGNAIITSAQNGVLYFYQQDNQGYWDQLGDVDASSDNFACGGNQFIVVRSDQQWYRSSDLQAFSPITAPYVGSVSCGYANDQMFLLGSDGFLASVTENNGDVAWNVVDEGVVGSLSNLLVVGDQFILLSVQYPESQILSSADGRAWNVYSTAPITSMKIGDNFFYGMGTNGTYFAVSSNLEEWSIYNIPVPSGDDSRITPIDIVYGNGVWIAVFRVDNLENYFSSNLIFYSTDIQSEGWHLSQNITQSSFSTSFNSIVYLNGLFYLYDISNSSVLATKDGIHWGLSFHGRCYGQYQSVVLSDNGYVYLYCWGSLYRTNGTNWEQGSIMNFYGTLHQLKYWEPLKTWVITAFAQSSQKNVVYVSSDGLHFSPVPAPGLTRDPTYTKFFATANGYAVSVGANSWSYNQQDIASNILFVANLGKN